MDGDKTTKQLYSELKGFNFVDLFSLGKDKNRKRVDMDKH